MGTRYILLLFFLIISFYAEAQFDNNWQLTFQVQPELTFHKKYSWLKGEQIWVTPNAGFSSNIQKNLNENLFVEAGFGYIPRRIKASADFDFHAMFPDYFIAAVAHITQKVTYKTLQFPVSIGLNISESEKARFFVKGTYVSNRVLYTQYVVQIGALGPFEYYYARNYWQSHAVNAAAGYDLRLTKKLSLTSAVAITLLNNVQPDRYLEQYYQQLALNYRNLQVSSGIKIDLN